MSALMKRYSLFYIAHSVTFFFLCSYSLVAKAPNFPFLPALFFPLYLSSAVALSERESADPMINILPITVKEIMLVKYILAAGLILSGWINMTIFTVLQDLGPVMTEQVMKLNALSCIGTILLAGGFQMGLQFYGWPAFHKFIIGFAILGGVFCLIFFIGLAESGHNDPRDFPLLPLMDEIPLYGVRIIALVAGAIMFMVLRKGNWGTKEIRTI